MKRNQALFGGTLLWVAAVSGGMATLWSYSMAPGMSAEPPAAWPVASRMPRLAGQSTLVVLAHPQCPCSRATMRELAVLMAQAEGRLAAHVLFLRPPGVDDAWVESDLWQAADRIPGVTAWRDDEGSEARRFGAATSGQTFLYDGEGRLRFSGGITAGRGHSGDNAGRSAVTEIVLGAEGIRSDSPVFGCPLFDEEETHSQGGEPCTTS